MVLAATLSDMKYKLFILFIILSYSCFSQSSVITDFKENHELALSLYFYPSTLRMINIDRNVEYDEMIRDIKKARFFKMDSGAVSKTELNKLIAELVKEGFEEVMFVKNKGNDVRVWGKEKRIPELIIISKSDEELMLLEINGMINIAKIPKLTQTFNRDGFLDVLNLTGKKNRN